MPSDAAVREPTGTEPEVLTHAPAERPQPEPALAVVNLRKRYGGTRYALDGVSLSFEVGITGLLGPNGAGKSSLIRCIAGVQNWEDGSVELGRRAVGYMPEVVALPRELRVRSFLRLVCSAKGLRRAWRREIEEKLALTGLEEVADRVIGSLSKGYRQRLGLAQALTGNPPVVVLDEPVSSLDPINVVDVRRAIRDYACAACVIVATHQLAEARALCDRVVVLDRGRVAFDGSMTELGRGRRLGFEIEVLPSQGEVRVIKVPDATEAELAARVESVVAAGAAVIGVRPVGDALEEAFAHAVRNA